MNRVLDVVPTAPAVHLCFGNYGGPSVLQCTWEQLMRYLNALHAEHVALECARRRPKELAVFRDPEAADRASARVVVDIKVTEFESAAAVARAIERAESLLGARRLKRSTADAKIRTLAKGRDLYKGRAA